MLFLFVFIPLFYLFFSADVSAQPGSNGVAVATLETPEGVPPPDPTDDSYFFPIPHKDGPDAPCGNKRN